MKRMKEQREKRQSLSARTNSEDLKKLVAGLEDNYKSTKNGCI
jgi:hypothetical protein